MNFNSMDSDKSSNEQCSDYGNDADDGVLGLVPYGFNSDSDESLDLPSKSQTRKGRGKVVNPAWFAAKNKKQRENGKLYLGKKKENGLWNHRRVRNAKVIGERCSCKKATSSAALHCAKITEDQRQALFKQFWQMDLKEKQTYVNTLIQVTTPARMRNRKDKHKSRGSRTFQYHVRVEQKSVKVCRKFFLNTLSIGRRTVLNWVKQPTISRNTTQNAPQQNCSIARESLNSFFNSLPTMESHYCRATTQKKYLLPEWSSKKQLFEFNVEDWFNAHGKPPLSISAFYNTLADQKLCLFFPKKDQCEICARNTVGDILDDVYNLHHAKKHEAREEKQKDKIEEAFVFTIDLQAVLMAPKAQVSSLYYRTKLQVHNLVFYNLINHDAYCFIWNEVEGVLSAEEFANIWVFFIENKIIPNLTENAAATKIILYSDGCTYQNRNVSMSNALLNTSIKHGVIIEQKILETGHTQMEADSVHSVSSKETYTLYGRVFGSYFVKCFKDIQF
ncbi:uncharacterized protein LOC126764482 [Bactrocera neohumeralis]|uniref:uncharacterized protein LOC126764482 n=1 Tax=Bactrocera neohumeralis TaxID=98809 RepID=UPI002165FE94|nr:uncharacterized protein LOC126764482 [Bactrocera neohumeralis]